MGIIIGITTRRRNIKRIDPSTPDILSYFESIDEVISPAKIAYFEEDQAVYLSNATFSGDSLILDKYE